MYSENFGVFILEKLWCYLGSFYSNSNFDTPHHQRLYHN